MNATAVQTRQDLDRAASNKAIARAAVEATAATSGVIQGLALQHEIDVRERRASEKRCFAMFDQSAVGVCFVSRGGRFLAANERLCAILGYTEEELLARTVFDVTHPEDRAAVDSFRRALLTAPRGTASGTRESRYLRKDGTVAWVSVAASVVHDDAGTPVHFISMVQDVTDRKVMSDRFQATFEQAAVGIAHVGLDGRYLMVNRKLCDMLGYTREELCAMNSRSFTVPEHRNKEGNRERLLRGEIDTYAGERQYVRKDGTRLWVNRTVSLAHDDQGAPLYFIRVVEDITERKRAESALRNSERFARSTIDALTKRLCVLDERGVIIAANKTWSDYVAVNDLAPDCIRPGTNYLLLCESDNAGAAAGGPEFAAGIRAVLRGDRAEFTLEFPYGSGNAPRWFVGRVSPFRSEGPRRVVVTHEDVTARKCIERELEYKNTLLSIQNETSLDAILLVDSTGRVASYNQRFVELWRLPPEIAGCGDDDRMLQYAISRLQDPERFLARVRELYQDRQARSREEIALKDGRILDRYSSPVIGRDGTYYGRVWYFRDITDPKSAQAQLVQLAHYDTLTGLANRVLFRERLTQVLNQANRHARTAGMLFIDLDRFKRVNDTLGHAAGDELLRQVAQRLTQCVRKDDTVGRFGGDEFAVILAELASTQDAGLVAQKILDALAAPFALGDTEVFVSASIGISLCPADSDNADDLIRNADAAMFSAKDHGRCTYHYYTAEMNQQAVEKMQLETGLRWALERNEFVLHYQPKVDLGTGTVSGLEALLRWHLPEDGIVPPNKFIPLLEETGLIVPVGEWVLREVLAQIAAWQRSGIEPVPVAVNISTRQLQRTGFGDALGALLDESGVDPKWLELEITESLLLSDPDAARAVLVNLHCRGVRLSVDDFGTGYSSLARLKQLPLHALKIDRSFVRDSTTDPDDAAITRSVVTLAHNLNLRVVAEGVETAEQVAFLRDNGCDEAQGYLFSRPLPPDQCTVLLRDTRHLETNA